ncbi:hypothetical protein ADL21_00830 [Streptomyces albus subsp. albus]|nr:hypothetical protein ADL21_00830 [Streptomyces albus subsp. albus]
MSTAVEEPVRPTSAPAGDTAPAPAAGAWDGAGPGAVMMLRINPLRRRRLAADSVVHLAELLRAAYRERDQIAPAASDELYGVIGTVTDGPRRARLLGLRRDIHGGRRPAPRVTATELATAGRVAEQLGDSVAAWWTAEQRVQDLEDRLAREWPVAEAAEREAVRELISQRDFRLSVALASPQVAHAMERYERAGATPTARDRKSERGILQYLTRAMMRTSPLSRFTAVGTAVHDLRGPALDEADFTGATALVDFDRPLLNHLFSGLIPASPADDPLITQPPTLRREETRVTFVSIAQGRMRRLAAPMTTRVRTLLELTGMGPRPLSRLVQDYARRLPAEPEQARGQILQAVRAGMLCTAWPVPETAADPYQEFLEQPGTAEPARQLVREMRRALRDVGEAGTAAERGAALEKAADSAGRAAMQAQRPARLLVDEDYRVAEGRVSWQGYEEALRDLADVTAFHSAFDRLHDVRALLCAAFVERHGEGARVNLVEHAEELVETVYRREVSLDAESAGEFGPRDGSLAALHRLRAETLAEIYSDLDARAGDEEVRWSAAELAERVARLPERFLHRPAAHAVVFQPTGGDIVWNDAYAGHSMLLSRFLPDGTPAGPVDASSARLVRDRLHRLYSPDGVPLLEDRGLHGVNVNRHPPVLDDALSVDDWYGLQLCHDTDTDDLHLATPDGQRVRVLSLGSEWPELFPYPLRLASWLTNSGRLILDLASEWCQARPPAGDGTRRVPRLRASKIVLQRQRWYPGTDFPTLEGDTAATMAALVRWRARHGVPDQVFWKSPLPESFFNELEDGDVREHFFQDRRRNKPQYVDLSSVLMGRSLRRFLHRRDAGYVEEALPRAETTRHAFEWVAELGRPAFGQFHSTQGPEAPQNIKTGDR